MDYNKCQNLIYLYKKFFDEKEIFDIGFKESLITKDFSISKKIIEETSSIKEEINRIFSYFIFECVNIIDEHNNIPINSMIETRDGEYIVSTSARMINIFNKETNKSSKVQLSGFKEPISIYESYDKNNIFFYSGDSVKFLNKDNFELIDFPKLEFLAGKVNNMSETLDGKSLIFLVDKAFKIVDKIPNGAGGFISRMISSTNNIFRWVHTGVIRCVIETKDSKNFISCADDGKVVIWDKYNNEKPLKILEHGGWVKSVVETKDCKYIISCSDNGSIKKWNKETGECTNFIDSHKFQVQYILETRDGENIISCSNDETIIIWDKNGNRLRTLVGHTNQVRSVIETKDGKFLISYAVDKTVRIWDKFTGDCVKFFEFDDYISSVIETQEGNIIVSCLDGKIRIFGDKK